jgi:glycosyltransferase involved in cell wall biosynthesis
VTGSDSSILFLSHEASRSGAPIVLLRLQEWFRRNTDLHFRTVLFEDGPLAADFEAIGPTTTLTRVGVGRSGLLRRISRIPVLGSFLKSLWHSVVAPRALPQSSAALVYANTVATARLIRQLVPVDVPLIVHVHELERAIQQVAGAAGMEALKSRAQRYIAVSTAVRDNLISAHGIDPSLIEVIPPFISIDESVIGASDSHRRAMRERLGIPADARVIGGCGATDWRKGADLFVEMAREARARFAAKPLHFVWIGHVNDDEFTRSLMSSVSEWGLTGAVHFVGVHPRPVELFCGIDIFALSSREDPMPLVALEAASAAKPIVCYAGAGGIPGFVGGECGKVAAPMTAAALAEAVVALLSDDPLRLEAGRAAAARVRREYDVQAVAPRVLRVIQDVAAGASARA